MLGARRTMTWVLPAAAIGAAVGLYATGSLMVLALGAAFVLGTLVPDPYASALVTAANIVGGCAGALLGAALGRKLHRRARPSADRAGG